MRKTVLLCFLATIGLIGDCFSKPQASSVSTREKTFVEEPFHFGGFTMGFGVGYRHLHTNVIKQLDFTPGFLKKYNGSTITTPWHGESPAIMLMMGIGREIGQLYVGAEVNVSLLQTKSKIDYSQHPVSRIDEGEWLDNDIIAELKESVTIAGKIGHIKSNQRIMPFLKVGISLGKFIFISDFELFTKYSVANAPGRYSNRP